MTPDFPQNNREKLEAKLTALLLGELPAHEAAALHRAMDDDPGLAELYARLKHTIELVRQSAASPATKAGPQPAPLKLSPDRREKLLAHFKTVAPKEFAPQVKKSTNRRRIIEWAAVAAVLLFFGYIAIPNFNIGRETSRKNAIINSLRLVDGAKQTWAMEANASMNATPKVAEVAAYLGRGGNVRTDLADITVAGETYIPGKVSEPPSIEMPVRKATGIFGKDIVARGEIHDGRVRLSFDDMLKNPPPKTVASLNTHGVDALASRTWGTRPEPGTRMAVPASQGGEKQIAARTAPASDATRIFINGATVVPGPKPQIVLPSSSQAEKEQLAMNENAAPLGWTQGAGVSGNGGTQPGQPQFAFSLDLNRNGLVTNSISKVDSWQFPANGTTDSDVPGRINGEKIPIQNAAPGNISQALASLSDNNVVTNAFVGDPEWIGVLQRPAETHTSDNKFTSRYAYVVLPSSNGTAENEQLAELSRPQPTFAPPPATVGGVPITGQLPLPHSAANTAQSEAGDSVHAFSNGITADFEGRNLVINADSDATKQLRENVNNLDRSNLNQRQEPRSTVLSFAFSDGAIDSDLRRSPESRAKNIVLPPAQTPANANNQQLASSSLGAGNSSAVSAAASGTSDVESIAPTAPQSQSTPLLGDIPAAGKLFKSESKSTDVDGRIYTGLSHDDSAGLRYQLQTNMVLGVQLGGETGTNSFTGGSIVNSGTLAANSPVRQVLLLPADHQSAIINRENQSASRAQTSTFGVGTSGFGSGGFGGGGFSGGGGGGGGGGSGFRPAQAPKPVSGNGGSTPTEVSTATEIMLPNNVNSAEPAVPGGGGGQSLAEPMRALKSRASAGGKQVEMAAAANSEATRASAAPSVSVIQNTSLAINNDAESGSDQGRAAAFRWYLGNALTNNQQIIASGGTQRALTQDTNNQTALYYQSLAKQKSENAPSNVYDATIVGYVNINGTSVPPPQPPVQLALQDQNKKSELATADAHGKPNTYARTNIVYTSPQRQRTYAKLNDITMGKVDFSGMTLSDVVRKLAEQTEQHDPNREGVNFIISKTKPAGTAPTFDPTTGQPISPEELAQVKISPDSGITNGSLKNVLDAIVKSADRPLAYKVLDYGIEFTSPSATPELLTSAFKVNPNAFYAELQKTRTLSSTNRESANRGLRYLTALDPTVDIQNAVISFLKARGVNLTPPNSVFFNDRQGTLTVHASADDLDLVQAALETLNVPATNAPVSPQQTDSALPKPAVPPPTPQPEILTSSNAFSTFSLNVSDVSFKLAAATLEQGQLPDPASIRSEEFINAFDYRDPEAAPGVPVAFNSERALYPFAHNRELLRFSLKTAAAGRQAGRPLNIVLLLDNSGSMERADRVNIIREALHVLAAQLQPQDTFSIVTFARTARLRVDGIPGNQAAAAAEEIARLTPEGGTNLGEALDAAYETALHHYVANGDNRVILLTDGAANLGDVDPDSLKRKVEAQRKQGISLDCFGIGWEGYNDDLLEVLTRDGDGRYGFINTPEEASTEFVTQIAGALHVAAQDVKVQVEFNPNRVTSYRQIGYAKHQLTKEQFRDNTVAAAQIAAQEAGNALYTIEINPQGEGSIGTVRVRYKVPATGEIREQAWDVPYTGTATPLEQSSSAMRLAATTSAFSEWLATSPFADEVTTDQLLNYLNGVPQIYGADTRPQKLEWMIRQARSISGK